MQNRADVGVASAFGSDIRNYVAPSSDSESLIGVAPTETYARSGDGSSEVGPAITLTFVAVHSMMADHEFIHSECIRSAGPWSAN